jgi:hypothetical protein
VFNYVAVEGISGQGYHCPLKRPANKRTISMIVGAAFRVGQATITVLGTNVTINGDKIKDNGPQQVWGEGAVTIDRVNKQDRKGSPTQMLTITAGDKFKFVTTKVTDAKVPTGYLMDTMTYTDDTLDDENVRNLCAIEGDSGDNVLPCITDSNDIMFLPKEITDLQAACGVSQCDTTETCGPQPPACDVCKESGIDCPDAKKACEEACPCGDADAIDSCVFDFCAMATGVVGDASAGEMCHDMNPCPPPPTPPPLPPPPSSPPPSSPPPPTTPPTAPPTSPDFCSSVIPCLANLPREVKALDTDAESSQLAVLKKEIATLRAENKQSTAECKREVAELKEQFQLAMMK